MKSQSNIIRELQEIYQTEPGAELRERILTQTQITPPRRVRRKIGLRTVLVTAVLVTVFVTTAFAVSNALREIVFENHNIEQYEPGEINHDGIEGIVGTYGVRDSYFNVSDYAGASTFNTVEELAEAAEFEVKEPSFLPENATLSQVVGVRYTEEEKIYEAHLGYHFERVTETSYHGYMINFRQSYIGENARMEIKTVYPIQKVTVNGHEATAILENSQGDIELYWMEGDMAYHLLTGGLDLDTVIAIAESV